MTTFQELGIRASLCDVLRNHGIKEATPVQEKAMPLVRAGSDCIVKAQTGTGKTLAFLLPIIEKIKPQAAVTQAFVITPTRDHSTSTLSPVGNVSFSQSSPSTSYASHWLGSTG